METKINNIQELWTFCIANEINIGNSIYDVLVEEKRLKKELEVYKRALVLCSELASVPKGEIGITSVGLKYYALNEARKELEEFDSEKSNNSNI